MLPERWEDTKGNIKDNFSVKEEGSDHIDDDGGVDVEFIVFEGPLGRIRLEHIARPIVLDKKTTFSRRIGSETAVDYVYSETEKSYKLIAYKWDESQDDWVEMEAGLFDK